MSPQDRTSPVNSDPPQSQHQLREKPISTILENNSQTTNPNYYFAMVDMNKNEIFFMNQVNPSDVNKTITSASDQSNLSKSTGQGMGTVKLNAQENQIFSAPMDAENFDKYFEDFP